MTAFHAQGSNTANDNTQEAIVKDALYKRTIALAGIVQATSLVKDLAQQGKADEAAFTASIYSIFQTDPDDIPAIYGNLAALKYGLENLIALLSPTATSLQMRYLLAIIHLQKKISRSPKMLTAMAQRINQTKKQVDYFSLTHPTVIANLADIYLNTISTFRFRIVIWGSQRILSVHENMEKIRALLLAGIRSSVLWRQMGGSRFQLIFSRAKIKAMAEKILASLE